jgi:hypothetical protein
MKVGIPVSFMDAHVLTQVVVSTEFLTTRGHRAFVCWGGSRERNSKIIGSNLRFSLVWMDRT